ncbi:MAG: DUF4233 domain-containing protein [Corynebacterium sp.]|nr:DUF4233 domain-containing protein [Corynebacterium sp.]
MRGFRGMVSATLLMEAISILLGLLVVLKIDGGSYWTTFNWGFVAALGTAHLVMLAFVTRGWALPTILGIQVVGLFGFFIHWSLGAIMVLFIAIWAFALHLRSTLIERMRRGYLTTQHLDAA